MPQDAPQHRQRVGQGAGDGAHGIVGAAQDIATRAVEAAEREREEQPRKQAMFLRRLGGGMLGAIANPATAGKPLP